MSLPADALIFNPLAQGGRSARAWRGFLSSAAGRAWADVPSFEESSTEALSRWIDARIASGARRFVAVGGDGTMHRLLQELASRASEVPELTLGAVGAGSSNDFHKPYSAPGRETRDGLRFRVDFARARSTDLGVCEIELDDGRSERRWFALNLSAGITAEANFAFNAGGALMSPLKSRWTNGAILWAALSTAATYRARGIGIAIDGEPTAPRAVTNLGIIKSAHFSGDFRYDLAPDPDDGKLYFHLCEGMSLGETLATMKALAQGRFSGRPKTVSRACANVVLDGAGSAFALETDGEVCSARKANVGLAPRALRICP